MFCVAKVRSEVTPKRRLCIDYILDGMIIFKDSSPSVIRAGIASGFIQNEIHDMMTISPGKSSIIFNSQ